MTISDNFIDGLDGCLAKDLPLRHKGTKTGYYLCFLRLFAAISNLKIIK